MKSNANAQQDNSQTILFVTCYVCKLGLYEDQFFHMLRYLFVTPIYLKLQKFLKEQQKLLQIQAEMKRAKSSPYINTLKSRFDYQDATSGTKYENIYNKTQINAIQDTMKEKRKSLELFLHKRHKSCPSLLSDNLEKNYNDFDSPCSSISRDISAANSEWELDSSRVSASNSEYDLHSPRSVTSSTTSFGDLKKESVDENRKSLIIDSDADFADTKVMEVSAKPGKAQHKVHFASEIIVDEAGAEKTEVKNLEASKDRLTEVGESKVADKVEVKYFAAFKEETVEVGENEPADEVLQDKPNAPSESQNSDPTEAEEGDILEVQKKNVDERQRDFFIQHEQHLGSETDKIELKSKDGISKMEEKLTLSSKLGETIISKSKMIQKSNDSEEIIDGHGGRGEIYENGPAAILIGSDSKNDMHCKFDTGNELQFQMDDLSGKGAESGGNGSHDGGSKYIRISSNESSNDSGNDNDNDHQNESDSDLQFEIELSGSHQDGMLNQDLRLNQDGKPLQDGRLNRDGRSLETGGQAEDNVNLYGHRVTEALSLTPRSSTGCSPRRSTQENFYLDQNSDDSVQVKT